MSLSVAQNPADAILDRLKESDTQRRVLRAYKDSGQPQKVREAVLASKATSEPSSNYRLVAADIAVLAILFHVLWKKRYN